MSVKLHRDVYVGMGLIVFCVIVIALALQIPSGANYLPLGLSIFMGVMSISILTGGIKQSKSGETLEDTNTLADSKKPILVYLMIVAYLFMFQILGYFVATPIFLISLQKYLKAGSWKRIILVTIGYMIFTYILFIMVLALPIYRVGIFGGLFRF